MAKEKGGTRRRRMCERQETKWERKKQGEKVREEEKKREKEESNWVRYEMGGGRRKGRERRM